MNPTDRYRQICTQTAQWLAKQPKRPDCRIETLQTRDPDGSLFYVIDIETPSHVCKINVNTPIFAPYCFICIEAAGLGSEATDYRWHDGECDPEDREIRIRLQELAEQIFSDDL